MISLGKRVRSNLKYGGKLVKSGFQGAAQGRDAFLGGERLSPFLTEAAESAWKSAVIGAGIGLLGGYLSRRSRNTARAVVYSALGGVIGFGAGLGWRTQCLTGSMTQGAMRGVNAARDERWLESHPIDYA